MSSAIEIKDLQKNMLVLVCITYRFAFRKEVSLA